MEALNESMISITNARSIAYNARTHIHTLTPFISLCTKAIVMRDSCSNEEANIMAQVALNRADSEEIRWQIWCSLSLQRLWNMCLDAWDAWAWPFEIHPEELVLMRHTLLHTQVTASSRKCKNLFDGSGYHSVRAGTTAHSVQSGKTDGNIECVRGNVLRLMT